jgi:hypothetical protein
MGNNDAFTTIKYNTKILKRLQHLDIDTKLIPVGNKGRIVFEYIREKFQELYIITFNTRFVPEVFQRHKSLSDTVH